MGIIEEKGVSPVINNNFLLRVEAIFDLPCRKVSNIQVEQEFEAIQEGGVNDYVRLRKKPASKPNTFQVERYIGADYHDPLILGYQPLLPILLYVSRYANNFDFPARTFVFTGCTVTAKNYGEMNAESSGLMVETTTIAFQQMYVINGFGGEPKPEWSFDVSGKKPEGIGQRKAILNQRELHKKDMEALSRAWPGTRSARTLTEFK